jgi:hypothetical protein
MSQVAQKCWICGHEFQSDGKDKAREHITKRADLRALFPQPTQANPIYLHDGKKRNRRIGSFDNNLLKWRTALCNKCNSSLTQPFDRAWDQLLEGVRNRRPSIRPVSIVHTNKIFKYQTHLNMLYLHLYFIKAFGCYIVDANANIHIGTFSKSILERKAHPNVYLRFMYDSMSNSTTTAGLSKLECLYYPNGTCAFATWLYSVGSLSINIMFAADGEKREGLIGAWHPRNGTSKLRIVDL